jgi:hypothetical protein
VFRLKRRKTYILESQVKGKKQTQIPKTERKRFAKNNYALHNYFVFSRKGKKRDTAKNCFLANVTTF